MFKIVKSKFVAIGLIFSIFLLYSPYLLVGQETGRGNFIGFIYGPDKTTPLEGATIKIRNISTVAVYESEKSDNLGIVKLEGVDEGLYVVGIITKEGDFNFGSWLGVKADETSKISFALEPMAQEEETVKKDKKCPRGDSYVPEVEGECDEGYKWNADTKRCECKKKRLAAFFLSPVGIALLVAASAGAVAVIATPKAEAAGSAFKK